MEKIKKFDEFIENVNERYSVENDNLHRLDEMAKISRDFDQLPKNAEVWVYGENDEQGTKTPHFHLKINNGKIELEIKLENIAEMTIWRTKHNFPKSWDGITDVRDKVKDWLMKPNKKRPSLYNWQRVVEAWNDANSSNEVEDDFVVPNNDQIMVMTKIVRKENNVCDFIGRFTSDDKIDSFISGVIRCERILMGYGTNISKTKSFTE